MDEYPSAHFLLQYSFLSLAVLSSHPFTIFLFLSLAIFSQPPSLGTFPNFLIFFMVHFQSFMCYIPLPLDIQYCIISLFLITLPAAQTIHLVSWAVPQNLIKNTLYGEGSAVSGKEPPSLPLLPLALIVTYVNMEYVLNFNLKPFGGRIYLSFMWHTSMCRVIPLWSFTLW